MDRSAGGWRKIKKLYPPGWRFMTATHVSKRTCALFSTTTTHLHRGYYDRYFKSRGVVLVIDQHLQVKRPHPSRSDVPRVVNMHLFITPNKTQQTQTSVVSRVVAATAANTAPTHDNHKHRTSRESSRPIRPSNSRKPSHLRL